MPAPLGLLTAAICCAAVSPERLFEVLGQVIPERQASVALHGATRPFSTSALTDARGRFRFGRILAGQYTVVAFVPGYGEKRTTIDVGPSSVDAKGRFGITVRLDSGAAPETLGATVSASELAIPESARKQYLEAQKRLGKRDVDGALERLQRAVELAPNYTAAWNNLGTIAYQTGKYPQAEENFRKALITDPGAFEPLVNLGGVLLTLEKIDEAYQYNLFAVLKRPGDALANSQLGMNYFALGKMDLAEKYLLAAQSLDPGHFSHPQLLLAEIYLRRHDDAKAAGELEEFVTRHPDWPAAGRMRAMIQKLRGR